MLVLPLQPKEFIIMIRGNLTLLWSGTSEGIWDISPVQPNSTTAAKTHGMKTLAKAWTCVKVVKIHDTLCVQGPSVIQSQLALQVAHFLLHLLCQCTTSSSRRTPFLNQQVPRPSSPTFSAFWVDTKERKGGP